ncbi:MAG: DNA (cytosine-5-)-methyltransferase [Agathobacter sp.]
MNIDNLIRDYLAMHEEPNTISFFGGFAGGGAEALGLKRNEKKLPLNFECVGISEINPNAIKGYEALHGKVKNFGDITKINYKTLPHFSLLTWSSPCQDNSKAGKRKGMKRGSGTRSELAWALIPLLEAKREMDDLPLLIVFENVDGIISGDIATDFKEFLDAIRAFGYTISYQILDANDYSCAQHRERLFAVCSLFDIEFAFPAPREKKVLLKDILDKDVDERWNYNSTNPITRSLYGGTGHTMRVHNPSYCTRAYTLTLKGTGRTEDNYFFREDISEDPVVRLSQKFLETHGIDVEKIYGTTIRSLTTNEAMKLSGLTDEEIKRLNMADLKKTHIYALMGNTICVNVIEDIFYEYFKKLLDYIA